MKWLFNWIHALLRHRHDSGTDLSHISGDSYLTALDLEEMEMDQHFLIEEWLQDLAMRDYGVGIKVVVFRRIKEGRENLLALLRMRDTSSILRMAPASFADELIARYNQLAVRARRQRVSYAIWSDSSIHSKEKYGTATIVRPPFKPVRFSRF